VTLEQLLVLLVDGGGGVFVYWLLGNPLKTWYDGIEQPDLKRWIAAGLTAVFALLAWIGGAFLGYFPMPSGGWQTWVVAIANVIIGAFVAFTSATLMHTKTLKTTYERAQIRARAKASGNYRGR
jgi:hypothetical protein